MLYSYSKLFLSNLMSINGTSVVHPKLSLMTKLRFLYILKTPPPPRPSPSPYWMLEIITSRIRPHQFSRPLAESQSPHCHRKYLPEIYTYLKNRYAMRTCGWPEETPTHEHRILIKHKKINAILFIFFAIPIMQLLDLV